MNKLLSILVGTIIFLNSCGENSDNYREYESPTTQPAAVPAEEYRPSAHPASQEDDLRNNVNIEFIKYCNAMNRQDVDMMMDYLFTPAINKAGLSKSNMRDAINSANEQGLSPTDMAFTSPYGYDETEQFYMFTIPVTFTMYIEGSKAKVKSKVFAFSEKSSDGRFWMFLSSNSQSEEIISKSYPDLYNKLNFTKPEIISYEQTNNVGTMDNDDNVEPDNAETNNNN